MWRQFEGNYFDIISAENLLEGWKEFLQGKRNKKDVQEFALHLMDNILELHRDLLNHTYKHGRYQAFNITDPKPRNIHKAGVRDRLLHHAIYRILYPFFEKIFTADSFSSQKGKGAHKALDRFRAMAYKVSRNHTRTIWILKCDIRKFFANIDHENLLGILTSYIPDQNILWLLKEVIHSFPVHPPLTPPVQGGEGGKGLPLGNLTSQLFVNVYMNEFDLFVKHRLKVKYYIRYADDFVILSPDKQRLAQLLKPIKLFLREQLGLDLHGTKVKILILASGIDFLGWVHFHDHRILRKSTTKRMMNRIKQNPRNQTFQSYLGLLRHGNAYKLRSKIAKEFILNQG